MNITCPACHHTFPHIFGGASPTAPAPLAPVEAGTVPAKKPVRRVPVSHKDDPNAHALAAVALATKRVGKSASSPILECVLLGAGADGSLTIDATALGVWLHMVVPGVSGLPTFGIAVSARALHLALKGGASLLGATVKDREATAPGGSALPPVPSRLHLSGGAVLPVFPGADFPERPDAPLTGLATIDTIALATALDRVFACVAGDDSRYGLNALYVESGTTPDGANGQSDIAASTVRFVATDGNRLAWAEAAMAAGGSMPDGWTLPRSGVEAMRAVLAATRAATVQFGRVDVPIEGKVDSYFALVADAGTITGRVAEVVFPEYRQVLPASGKRQLTVDVAPLRAALKRCLPYSTDIDATTKWGMTADALTVSAKSYEAGSQSVTLAARLKGEPLTTGFNTKYVLDALDTLGTDEVTFDLGDVLSPVIARANDATGRRLVCVMPQRLD